MADPKIELPGKTRSTKQELSGSRPRLGLIYLAINLWDRIRVLIRKLARKGDPSQNQNISPENEKEDGRGRPTIPDNFLVGSRNAWVCLLEESWPDVGWSLLSIRKRRASSIQDVQSALAPLKAKYDGTLASAYLRQTASPSNAELIRKGRIALSALHEEIQDTIGKIRDAELSCNEVSAAFLQKQLAPSEIDIIERKCADRFTKLIHLRKRLPVLEPRASAAETALADQEADFSQNQLLSYLAARRYAVEPLNIANALAGLPIMGWRQSYERCSAMPYESQAHFSYRLLKAITQILEKRPDGALDSPVDFFKAGLSGLKKDQSSVRDYLQKNWHDFRISMEECLKAGYSSEEFAFALARNCITVVATPKSPTECILAENEELKN